MRIGKTVKVHENEPEPIPAEKAIGAVPARATPARAAPMPDERELVPVRVIRRKKEDDKRI